MNQHKGDGFINRQENHGVQKGGNNVQSQRSGPPQNNRSVSQLDTIDTVSFNNLFYRNCKLFQAQAAKTNANQTESVIHTGGKGVDQIQGLQFGMISTSGMKQSLFSRMSPTNKPNGGGNAFGSQARTQVSSNNVASPTVQSANSNNAPIGRTG